MAQPGKFRFSIDRGGTFTDVFAEVPDPVQPFRVLKLLSEDPRNYPDAPREGIRRILESVTGVPLPRSEPVPVDRIESITMGTTVATNALLERKGTRTALVTTAGFANLLHIGSQARPLIFDLRIAKPDNLYEVVVEVGERVVLIKGGDEDLPDHLLPTPSSSSSSSRYAVPVVTGSTGERLVVERAPDEAAVRSALQAVRATGISSVAVAFLHSYTFPDHERLVGRIAREVGFAQVSLSSDVMPMVKIVPRGYTACADAYLTPHIVRYVDGFRSGFAGTLEGPGAPRLLFMQSDGGLTPVQHFSGHRAILSGPAGGVVGYARTTYDAVGRRPVVAFDMGGTSTDVSRYDGSFEHVYETTTAGVTIQAPQLDINTVAAGGGSRLFFRAGLMVVGPESAGAHPGPVCYRKGGHLAVTDANLQLGRIVPEEFPHIFGETEDQPLDAAATAAAFASLADEVNAFYAAASADGSGASKSVDEVAAGFLQVANEAMCRPIRALTQMRGHDLTTHVLACFGGAGPQHACAMARALGMRTVFISRFSGILSAYGLSLADVVNEAQAPVASSFVRARAEGWDGGAGTGSSADEALSAALADARPEGLDPAVLADLAARVQALCEEVGARLEGQGLGRERVAVEVFLNLRYHGTDTGIMTPCCAAATAAGGGAGRGAAGGEDEEDAASSASGGSSGGDATIPLAAALEKDGDAGARLLAALIATAGARYIRAYKREFGFVLRKRDIVCDDVRVRGIAKGSPLATLRAPPSTGLPPTPVRTHSVFFEGLGRVQAPLYMLRDLCAGDAVRGPAMILDKVATVVVEPGFTAALTDVGDILITAEEGGKEEGGEAAGRSLTSPPAVVAPPAPATPATGPSHPSALPADPLERWRTNPLISRVDDSYADIPADPIRLSLFSHRFMGIAEQMGRTLQRTSVSVNMRERLDYSCALFGPDGGLVANAPHIPVHLGAMQDAVRFQLGYWGADLADGDVLVSNHPQLAGGSHLPDITVITPVFAGGEIVFFVASRGHHADIGGIAPGSMPPLSKTLAEEGAAIVAFKLVDKGLFQEAGITDLLLKPGTLGLPGCTGARNLGDCLSDLRAQVAANTRGIRLVRELIGEYGLRVVHAYMRHIQTNAEVAVREMLAAFSRARGLPPVGTVRAVDYMDDGTPIALAITIDRDARTATFDFEGTGPEVFANTNAPRAVTYSAIIYSLRCLVGSEVPLNQGCLAPVTIRIPAGSILHPSATAAVVGGNVLTSQRVVDVVLKAFGACAASQGCMNNLTFGSTTFGYYETIAGGAGAGPSWHGRSGVHTHMTNTRITDPEILERRYPVVLRAFSLRSGSGGRGAWRGGDGVVRHLQFRKPLTVSVLSERRAFAPYGLNGGGPGARGVNTLRWADGRRVNLGGKNTASVCPGDHLILETPGGGGYGAAKGEEEEKKEGTEAGALDEREYAMAVAAARAAAGSSVAAAASTAPAGGLGGPVGLPPEMAGRASGSLSLMAETQQDF
jgi:5-oxoprolinase (ATP-hydrolysing)